MWATPATTRLGQVTERRLGSTTGVVRQLYTYPAAENFRLVSQQAGTAAPYTDLQNLSYTYDDTGNVLTISDAAAYGGSQTPDLQPMTPWLGCKPPKRPVAGRPTGIMRSRAMATATPAT